MTGERSSIDTSAPTTNRVIDENSNGNQTRANGSNIVLSAFLRMNDISISTYKRHSMGTDIILPTNPRYRNSPVLTPENQQNLQQVINTYKSRRSEPAQPGNVWLYQFLVDHNIPRNNIYVYGLIEGLAEKKGKKILKGISPEDQEVILKRWQEVLEKKGQGKSKAPPLVREQRGLSTTPQINELTSLVVQISSLDPQTFTELYQNEDPEIMSKVSSVINSLTPAERDVVSPSLSGLSDNKIAQRLKTSVAKVRTIKQIAVERLTMMAAEVQEKPAAATVQKDLQERFSFLANLTPNKAQTMFTAFMAKLPIYPTELTWQKIAEGLEIEQEEAITLIYLAHTQEAPMSFSAFLQNEGTEIIPKYKMGNILKTVFELIMERGDLFRVFVEAHETNVSTIISREKGIQTINNQQNNSPTQKKGRRPKSAGVPI